MLMPFIDTTSECVHCSRPASVRYIDVDFRCLRACLPNVRKCIVPHVKHSGIIQRLDCRSEGLEFAASPESFVHREKGKSENTPPPVYLLIANLYLYHSLVFGAFRISVSELSSLVLNHHHDDAHSAPTKLVRGSPCR